MSVGRVKFNITEVTDDITTLNFADFPGPTTDFFLPPLVHGALIARVLTGGGNGRFRLELPNEVSLSLNGTIDEVARLLLDDYIGAPCYGLLEPMTAFFWSARDCFTFVRTGVPISEELLARLDGIFGRSFQTVGVGFGQEGRAWFAELLREQRYPPQRRLAWFSAPNM